VLELCLTLPAFWTSTGAAHRNANPLSANKQNSRTREALTNKISWICAIFLLGYVGVEVSLGGWLVTFMLKVRNGGAFESGMTVTGFWLGITVGRIILGFVTPRIGEKLAIATYLVLSMGLELMFWLIPSFIASAIMAGLLGFFLAPLFPAAVVVATKLLPRHLHVSAIGFAAAFGGGGAALFPFAVGAIASARGVQVLQPIVLALLAALLALWCTLPGGFKKKGLDMVNQEEVRPAGEVQWLRESVGRLRQRFSAV
jgi:fucose permease